MSNLINQELEKIRESHALSQKDWRQYPMLLAKLIRLLRLYAWARYCFRTAQLKGHFIFARGKVAVRNKGLFIIGNKTRVWGNIHPAQFFIGKKAELRIGEGCYINGSLIAAERSVLIGKNCYLAPMAHVLDNPNFGLHPGLSAKVKPIVIEDDAWLATRCTVLGGVTIGKGAVVAVGALVDQDVPPYSVVAGVPAKVVRYLDEGMPATDKEKHATTSSLVDRQKLSL